MFSRRSEPSKNSASSLVVIKNAHLGAVSELFLGVSDKTNSQLLKANKNWDISS